MTETVIRAENLGKRYVLGTGGNPGGYVTLRESMMTAVRAPLRRLRDFGKGARNGQKAEEEFWALRDISFEVRRGEVVGIIGRNGAGKSTLLKILSRITEPTEGKISLRGRVASLLEVGTGFHPELTGRENIFLNGAILGMRGVEIKAKFDEIVAFAEVERFLDTPVKRYSSGMYVRLAFAVAAHLEPEILIVDEVLAVGDAEFQKKCLGKIESVSKLEGRTVLFVSHQLGMITSLCTRVALMEGGRISAMGSAAEIVREYYGRGQNSSAVADFTTCARPPGNDEVQLEECHIENAAGAITSILDLGETVTVSIRFRVLKERRLTRAFIYPQINLFSSRSELIFSCMPPAAELGNLTVGSYVASCCVPANFLNNETYYVGVGMACCENEVKVYFYESNVLSFQISERLDETLYTTRNGFGGPMGGSLRPQLPWRIDRLEMPPSVVN